MFATTEAARQFDRLTDQLFSGAPGFHGMPMDLYRSGDHYVMNIDVPGVDPGSIDVSVDRGVLTIRATRTARTREGVDWVTAERPTGTFMRQLRLGDALDTERIGATYTNGVLTLTLPIAETAKPRKIAVSVADDTKRIHTTTEQAAVESNESTTA